MLTIFLIAFVTVAYAGYNLFVKVATDHLPATTTSTVLATLSMQVMTLIPTLCLFAILSVQGGHDFKLSSGTLKWAMIAGLCIGSAEVGYYYIFSGLGGGRAMPANVVIPIVVCGTVVITAIVSFFIFRESFSWPQILGSALVIGGVFLILWGPRS